MMATPFDELWEYYEPDPEIAELLALAARLPAGVMPMGDVRDGWMVSRRERPPGCLIRRPRAVARCPQCRLAFAPKESDQKFCGTVCQGAARVIPTKASGCPRCGGPMPDVPGPARARKYCSLSCQRRAKASRNYLKQKEQKTQ